MRESYHPRKGTTMKTPATLAIAAALVSLVALLTGTTASAAELKSSARQANLSKALPKTAQLKPLAPLSSRERRSLSRYLGSVNNTIARSLSKTDRARAAALGKQAEAIAKIEDDAKRAAAIAGFNKKQSGLQRQLLSKAKVSNQQVVARLNQLLPNRNFKLTGGRAAQIQSVLQRTAAPQPSTNSRPRRLREYPVTLQQSGCVGLFNPVFGPSQRYRVKQSSVLASGCHSDYGVGTTIEVPPGTQQVRVEIDLRNGFRLSSVAAGVVGYAQANSDLGVHIRGPGVDRFELDNSVIAVAPIIFVESNRTEGGRYTLYSNFTPDRNGGNYRIMLYSGHFTMGVGFPSVAQSIVEVPRIDSIQVEMIEE